MSLYSPFFLLAFLPVSAAVYNTLPQKYKTAAMCIISLVFYAFAAGKFFFLLPCLAILTYAFSFWGRRAFLPILLLLPLFRIFGISAVGLAFFIVRAAAYVYNEHCEKNILKVFSFLMFFPCIHSGPLAEYSNFESRADFCKVSRGILILLAGALKKMFFADSLAVAFDIFLSGSTSLSALFALFAYALYIYFDFSGCSDMSRGAALMFGFSVPKNFDFPYMSKSICEFFRRWHITLGRWLYRYIYLPLGGSKSGKARLILSLLATWLVSALWHGNTFSYLLWGGYFFLISAFEKLIGKGIGRCATLFAVLFGWALFFSETPLDACNFFYRLFALGGTLLYSRGDIYNCLQYAPLMLFAALCATPVFHKILCALYEKARPIVYLAAPVATSLVLSFLAVGGHKPFLYAAF